MEDNSRQKADSLKIADIQDCKKCHSPIVHQKFSRLKTMVNQYDAETAVLEAVSAKSLLRIWESGMYESTSRFFCAVIGAAKAAMQWELRSSMEQRLSLVTLGVADLQRARKFYEECLGWRVSKASEGDIVFFQLGGIALALYPRKLLADDATVEAQGSGFSGITLSHNVRDKGQVGEVLKRAAAGGARIVKPAQDVFWGGHSGYFADLDGHLWEVAWNPHFEVSESGDLILSN